MYQTVRPKPQHPEDLLRVDMDEVFTNAPHILASIGHFCTKSGVFFYLNFRNKILFNILVGYLFDHLLDIYTIINQKNYFLY